MKKIETEVISQEKYLQTKELEKYLKNLAELIIKNKKENILLIPPDYTRKSSGLGVITQKLYFFLEKKLII
jgi:nickel-dependent lactate racemase